MSDPKAPKSPKNADTPGKRRINSKQKGNTYERQIARIFREVLGLSYAGTSRQRSRLLDDCGIDIAGVPMNVSLKSGYKGRRPKPEEIFKTISERLKKHFPEHDPIHGYLIFLFHKLDGYHPAHHIVSMTFDDWCRLMVVYLKNQ